MVWFGAKPHTALAAANRTRPATVTLAGRNDRCVAARTSPTIAVTSARHPAALIGAQASLDQRVGDPYKFDPAVKPPATRYVPHPQGVKTSTSAGDTTCVDVVDKDGLALIPITNKAITEFYPRAEIPAGTYAWQAAAVNTVAPKAVLISFDFRRKDCDTVGKLAQLVSSRIEWLQKNGHPKWKSVDLNYPLRGWEQYDCVKKYIGKATPATPASTARTGINPVLDAIRGMLEE